MIGFTNSNAQKSTTPPPPVGNATIRVSMSCNQGNNVISSLKVTVKVNGQNKPTTAGPSQQTFIVPNGANVEITFPGLTNYTLYPSHITQTTSSGANKVTKLNKVAGGRVYNVYCDYKATVFTLSAKFGGKLNSAQPQKYRYNTKLNPTWIEGTFSQNGASASTPGASTKITIPYGTTFNLELIENKYWKNNGVTGNLSVDTLFANRTYTWSFYHEEEKPQVIVTIIDLCRADVKTGSMANADGSLTYDKEDIWNTSNTANCYVIHNYTKRPNETVKYKFPVVPGNFIQDGWENPDVLNAYCIIGANSGYVDERLETTKFVFGNGKTIQYFNDLSTYTSKVEIIESDVSTGIDNVIKNSDISLVTKGDLKWVEFEIGEFPPSGGNIILGAKDSSGTVLWTWHLWLYPTYLPESVSVVANNIGSGTLCRMMPINLGSIQNDTTNTLYQWGRPTPLIPRKMKNKQGIAAKMADGIANPTTFYHALNQVIWYDTQAEEYGPAEYACRNPFIRGAWYEKETNQKMIYDPSPYGYRVADFDSFTTIGSTDGHNIVKIPSSISREINGFNYIDDRTGSSQYFPCNYTVEEDSGELLTDTGAIWTNSAEPDTVGSGLSGSVVTIITSPNINTLDYQWNPEKIYIDEVLCAYGTWGYAVRCIEE